MTPISASSLPSYGFAPATGAPVMTPPAPIVMRYPQSVFVLPVVGQMGAAHAPAVEQIKSATKTKNNFNFMRFLAWIGFKGAPTAVGIKAIGPPLIFVH